MHTAECLILTLSLALVNGQSTIDTSNPILFLDNYSGNSVDSSFGYTVTLMKNNFFSTNQQSSSVTGWVFIGAPKGNYIEQQRQQRTPTNEPGIIWRCTLGSSEEVCETVDMQSPFSQSVPYCQNTGSAYCPWRVNQNGSWMGGSMTMSPSQSFRTGEGSFVSCGHRWQRTGTSNYENVANMLNGICSWLPQSSLSSSLTNIKPIALIPLGDEDKRYYRDSYSNQNDYEYYYGEAGFSSHLTEDNKLILGAPGVHTWSGTVIYYDNPQASPSILKNEYPEIQILDLYGYSVTSGRFFENSEIIFAAGAPRASNLYGRVLFFQRVSYYNKNDIRLVQRYTLQGTQLGSYFGFTLCAVDIDGDKVDELLVGAPFSSLPEKDNSAIEGMGDQGCIKIYSLSKRQEPDTICSKEGGARFGSAIVSLGDINNDNYNDFAVGAPNENGGRGAVYIYYGRRGGFSFNKDPTATQIIKAADIASGINKRSYRQLYGFGSSLHGGVDIDGNGTPDLVIGSYNLSKTAVVFRTRPTSNLRTVTTFLISGKKAEKFSRDDKDFVTKFCIDFRITPRPTHATELQLWSYVAVDKIHKRFSISRDDSSRKNEFNSGFMTEFLVDILAGEKKCIYLTMRREKEFEAVIPASRLQIEVETQVWYNKTENLPIETISYSIEKTTNYEPRPRVVVSGGKKFKDFCTHCPVSKKHELMTESLSIEKDDCKSDGNPECDSKLQFSKLTLLAEEVIKLGKNNQYPYEIGSSKRLALRMEVRNDGETAYNPIVEMRAAFNDEIRPIGKHGCEKKDDEDYPLQKIFQCKIGRPLHRDKPITEEIAIDVSSLYARNVTSFFPISIYAYPLDKKRISKTISIEMKAEAKIQLTGSTDERQSSVSDTSHINIVHTYTASLKGKSPINSVTMKFLLPVNYTRNGKETQTLISVSKPSSVVCSPTKGSFGGWNTPSELHTFPSNSDNSTKDVALVRSKRDTKSPPLQDKDTLAVHCDKDTHWKCMEINCETKLSAGGSIKVDFVMHIDNDVARSILKKEHKKIVVKSRGYVGILSENTKDYKRDANSYTSVAIILEEEFPVWIAVVAGIGGLILLLLIILCLWRCGFFRRKTKEDLKALKSKSENDALLGEHIPMHKTTSDEDSD